VQQQLHHAVQQHEQMQAGVLSIALLHYSRWLCHTGRASAVHSRNSIFVCWIQQQIDVVILLLLLLLLLLLQTDVYLEELTDVVPEADTTTQTDAFLDRPPTPQFVPTKSGTDAATQIEQGERMSASILHAEAA
jgi:hypothetical protein